MAYSREVPVNSKVELELNHQGYRWMQGLVRAAVRLPAGKNLGVLPSHRRGRVTGHEQTELRALSTLSTSEAPGALQMMPGHRGTSDHDCVLLCT